jgi:hypothetical protein
MYMVDIVDLHVHYNHFSAVVINSSVIVDY